MINWSEFRGDGGAGAPALRGDAGGAGLIQPGAKMALGGLAASLSAYGKVIEGTEVGSPKWGWAGRKTQRTKAETQEFRPGCKETLFLHEDNQTEAKVSQGGCAVSNFKSYQDWTG